MLSTGIVAPSPIPVTTRPKMTLCLWKPDLRGPLREREPPRNVQLLVVSATRQLNGLILIEARR